MLQNTCLIYELLYIFEETRARCVLAGSEHDWLRGEACKRLVKGPTRPPRVYSEEQRAKLWAVVETMTSGNYCPLRRLGAPLEHKNLQIPNCGGSHRGRVGTKSWYLCPIISRTHTLPRDLGECGTQRIWKTVCQQNSGSEDYKLW